jgi:uncharacterized protein (UPF0147 family)
VRGRTEPVRLTKLKTVQTLTLYNMGNPLARLFQSPHEADADVLSLLEDYMDDPDIAPLACTVLSRCLLVVGASGARVGQCLSARVAYTRPHTAHHGLRETKGQYKVPEIVEQAAETALELLNQHGDAPQVAREACALLTTVCEISTCPLLWGRRAYAHTDGG